MQSAHAELLAAARRRSRLAHEAEDLVQDALLAALEAGRADLDDPLNRRWLKGVIANQARMSARAAVRRKARDAHYSSASVQRAADEPQTDHAALFAWVRTLRQALRPVAALALTGHTRGEICSALGISDAALRQRLRALKLAAESSGYDGTSAAWLRTNLPHGTLRRTLTAALKHRQASVGTYDPDGNLLIFRTSTLTNPQGAATGVQTSAAVAGAMTRTDT